MSINETVLEMHYHKPLMDLFRDAFGLGENGQINFYKYSPQRECFIGFDQAYVKTQISEDELFRVLKESAASNSYVLKDTFVGYYLQFKVVKQMKKRTQSTPSCITSNPHYRVQLSTKKNQNTGFSQHEHLWNLKSNKGAMVYYACPMIFEREDLYDIDIDLETLRLVDVESCPSEYSDNGSHSIYFNDQVCDPFWCSEPVRGVGISPRNFAQLLVEQINDEGRARESAISLLKTLEVARENAKKSNRKVENSIDSINDFNILANILTVVRVSRQME